MVRDEDEIDRLFNLHKSNKISKKNVFELRTKLAECIYRMSKKGEVDFQKASGTLMIATNIYSYKVDALYDSVNQLCKGEKNKKKFLSQFSKREKILHE